MNKTLRKVIKLGSSKAITIPTDFIPEASYVWLEKVGDAVKITAARVE